MGKSQTTQSKSETKAPYGPAIPHINSILGEASNLYASGAGTGLWSGQNVANLSPTQQSAFDEMARISGSTPSFRPAMQAAMNGVQGGGQSTGLLGNIASGTNGNYINTSGSYNDLVKSALGIPGINTGGQFRAVADSAAGPTAASTYLTDMAKGGGTNPYLTAMLDANADRIGNRVSSAMSGAGRYGSFAHGDGIARSIAETNNPILAQAYESDQNRRLQASGLIDSSQRAADATRLGAISGETGVQGQNITNHLGAVTTAGGLLGGITDIQRQNIANQMGAQGAMTQQAQQWASMLPQLAQAEYMGADKMAGVGGLMTARSQAELDAQKGLFQQQQQMPWTQLGNYANMTYPTAGFGGTMTGTATQQNTPGAVDWFKTAMQAAPTALMMMSDRNTKTDIEKVGKSEQTGLDIFSYRYKGDPKNYPKVVGPMAQDIEKKHPGSTQRVNGLLTVKPHATGLLGVL